MKKFKLIPLLVSMGVIGGSGSLIGLNIEQVNEFIPEIFGRIANFLGAGDSNIAGLAATAAGFLFGGGSYSWARRVKTTGRVNLGDYFARPEYTNFPEGRMGYSDRLSYTLAELSDLAYWDVFTDDELATLKGVSESTPVDTRSTIVNIAKTLLTSSKQTTKEKFEEVLDRGGFDPVEGAHSIRSTNSETGEGTQAFVCVHRGFEKSDDADSEESDGEGIETSGKHQPYIVVAFRGTEVDIDDWLTNIDAVPASEFEHGLVHQGFYKAYRSVQTQVLKAVGKARENYGEDTPVFFTGHSLGGALAMVATRLNGYDTRGACYTYGCPRVGNYSFYKGVKTPVFRVVNSSDLVPRVPPGVWSKIVLAVLKLLTYLASRSPSISTAIETAMGWVDKINDYKHYGDLRYLPDIPSAEIDDQSQSIRELQILSNPDKFDMIQWFFRHLLTSFGAPIKSHTMKLYRNKLLLVANNRMQPFDSRDTPL